jgi:hypothetical protein
MDHKELYEALQQSERVTVKYKDESLLMRLIGKLMFYNPGFSTHVITTIGETVYFPSRSFVEDSYQESWMSLAHELVHVEDYRKNKVLFMLGYAMPQLLSLLALLAPVLWSWWPLLALVFLAPLPAPWRRDTELRGYAMSMAVWYWQTKKGIPQALKANIAGFLTGPDYYFTWPFKKDMTDEVGRWSKRVLCNELSQYGDVFVRVQKMVEARISKGRSG